MITMLLSDIDSGIRTLRTNPGFAWVAVLTLALGIGANTAIFSVVNAVLLRPLPYAEPDRLFVVYEQRRPPIGRTRASVENFLDLQRHITSFDRLAAYSGTGFTLSGNAEPELVIGQVTSGELFDVLGVRPLLGRVFTSNENEAGRDQVMVLSYGLWQRRFGGDPAVLGRSMTANGKPYTIVGVMPEAFEFPSARYELWAPFPFRNNADGMVNRNARFLQVVGRLRDGVTPQQAQAELDTLGTQLGAAYPQENANVGLGMVSLTEETVGDVRSALLLLMIAVVFVLLIACANVTNLLLARATARQSELAIRTSLGASRGRLIRQLLTETVALYAVGTVAGITLAAWSLDILIAVSPADIPRLDHTALDVRTLMIVSGVSLLTGVMFGVAPAVQSTRQAPIDRLKTGARTMTSGQNIQRSRMGLVALEVALALMLLVSASLAVRSLWHLQNVPTGFAPEDVLTFSMAPPQARYPDASSLRRFHDAVLERLTGRPGMLAVGATTYLPLSGQGVENTFTPEGWTPSSSSDVVVAGVHGVNGAYFTALGIPLKAGRALNERDTDRSEPVAMVNEEFAARYWPSGEPIGKRLKMGGIGSTEPWHVVVGVYANVKHHGLAVPIRPEVALPYGQLDEAFMTRWARGMSVVLRTSGDPMSVLPLARSEIRDLDPILPLVEPRPMTTLVFDAVAQPRFRGVLLALFAVVAGLLAAVGIYAVVAFMVQQRSQEISIRVALGAQRRDVLRLVLSQGALPVAVGMAAGLIGAIGVGRAMQGLLFSVLPNDPLTFIVVPCVLALVALIASYMPARRALRLDPSNALRDE